MTMAEPTQQEINRRAEELWVAGGNVGMLIVQGYRVVGDYLNRAHHDLDPTFEIPTGLTEPFLFESSMTPDAPLPPFPFSDSPPIVP